MLIEVLENTIRASSRRRDVRCLNVHIFCLLFAFSIVLPSTSLAATYYCDPVNGNNDNNGLDVNHAWAGLVSALEAHYPDNPVTSGDTIKCLTGYHGEFVYNDPAKDVLQNAVNTDYITCEAADGADPCLGRIYVTAGCKYWKFKGFNISTEHRPEGWKKDAKLIYIRGGTGESDSGYIWIEDCNIHSWFDNRLEGVDTCEEKAALTQYADGIALATLAGGHCTIKNCKIWNVENGVSLGGVGYNLLSGNEIYQTFTDYIKLQGGNYNVIENNYCHDSLKNYCGGHVDCIQRDNSRTIPPPKYATIRDNIFIFTHDYSDPNSQSGCQGIYIQIETCDPNVADCNEFKAVGWQVENNLFVVASTYGIRLDGATDCNVVNNTIVLPYNYSGTANPKISSNPSALYEPNNFHIHNNIVYNWQTHPNTIASNNLDLDIYPPTSVFVDYVGGDYRLNAESPAIGYADPDYATSKDILGNPRDSEPDAGCYEYISSDSGNSAPVLAAIGDKTVDEGSLLTFSVSATDADGDTITYSATSLPSGASFVNQTFSWTPGYDQAGTYQVTFTASDTSGAQDSETITITVNNVNRSPELQSIGNKSVNENDTLSFTISASDPDGDAITYSVDPLPSGAAFGNGTFTWTPGYDQAGIYTLTFTASDGQAQDSETISVTVNNVNRKPVLDAIADQSVCAGDTLSFAVIATDADGDSIQYSASGLPSGASFSGRSFSWTPTSSQAGSYSITFTASDGQLADSKTVAVTVSADNKAPQVTECSPGDGEIQVPLNNLIILHVVDDGAGVDANSVTIKVDDSIVYTGGSTEYESATGRCLRLGTAADYKFVYQSNQMFDFDQTVTVTVSAADLSGNTMSAYSYQFETEMLSFGENKLVSSDNLSKSGVVTVRDSSGNIWTAWQAGTIGSRDIYIARMAANTSTFSKAVRLTTNPADQCNPDLAIDSDDKLYLVWQDNRRGNWDIYIRTSADGTSWSSERRITDSNDNQVNPAIAVDDSTATPTAYLTWQSDQTGNQDIFAAASNNDFLTSTVWQVTTESHDQLEPAITADSTGVVYIVWTDQRNGSKDIYGAASNNGPWQNLPIVTKQGDQSSPVIAAEQTGSMLHMLWVDEVSGNKDIYYASSEALPSSPLTGTNIVDDETGADQSEPAIVVTGSTGENLKVYACWKDNRNLSTSGDSDIYFVQIGTADNIFVGDDGTNSNQSMPALGAYSSGRPYLLWADDRGTSQNVYYAGATFPKTDALASGLVLSSAHATIGPSTIADTDDASVIVPEGACPYKVTIEILKVQNPPKLTLQRFSLPFEFGPSGLEFSKPVTVTIPYTVSGDGQSVSAYWYDPLTGTLSQQGITNVQTIKVSSDLYALRFNTTHFTQFFVGGESITSGGGGGGGGCTLVSYDHNGSVTEFLLPYTLLAAVIIILKLRDARNRARHGNA